MVGSASYKAGRATADRWSASYHSAKDKNLWSHQKGQGAAGLRERTGLEQGPKLLKHRVLAAGVASGKAVSVGNRVNNALDLMAAQRVWEIKGIDTFVRSSVVAKKSMSMVTRGINAEYDLPLRRHP